MQRTRCRESELEEMKGKQLSVAGEEREGQTGRDEYVMIGGS